MAIDGTIVERESDPTCFAQSTCTSHELVDELGIEVKVVAVDQHLHRTCFDLLQRVDLVFLGRIAGQDVTLVQPQGLGQHTQLARRLVEGRILRLSRRMTLRIAYAPADDGGTLSIAKTQAGSPRAMQAVSRMVNRRPRLTQNNNSSRVPCI